MNERRTTIIMKVYDLLDRDKSGKITVADIGIMSRLMEI
jgi:hypothetical protein